MSKKKLGLLSALCLLILLMAGCGAKEQDPLCGDWAYNHDPGTVVLSLKSSGKAVLDGERCTWVRGEGGISLTTDGGQTTFYRCVEEKDRILFYRPAVYTAVDEPQGLVGRWVSENNWSYEFTGKGTFLEDGVLPGHYFVDEDAGTIKLAYNDPLEDTVLYYTLAGETLYVDYPWTMVKAR